MKLVISRRRKPWNTSHRAVAYLDGWLRVSGRTHHLVGRITHACLGTLQKNNQSYIRPLVNSAYQFFILISQ